MPLKLKNLLVFAMIPFAMSCQKSNNTPADPSKVSVIFNTLTEGQVFHRGDTIQINTNVTYDGEIAGIAVQVTDTATDSLLYADDQDTHTDNFPFQRTWVDDYSDSAVLEVKIFVFLANNTTVPATRSIYIRSVP